MINNSQVEVTVICLAYNHSKYIRKTLEGFVSQKTNFRYEIIIHDDASTDGTAQIINEFALKYPEKIRAILQNENQYSQKISIWTTHIVPLVNGKYVALCEGDDYWTDFDKLQKQYDILESNPQCSMCTHQTEKIHEDGTPMNKLMPRIPVKGGELGIQDFLNIERFYPFHTSSYFMRSDLWRDFHNNPPEFRKLVNVGDRPLLLHMVSKGNIYYLPVCMSVYRIFSIGSWSSRNKNDASKVLEHHQKIFNMMKSFDEYSGKIYDCKLKLYEGNVYWYSENYSELIKKEYRGYLKQIGIKKDIYIYVCALFPFLRKIRPFLRRLIKRCKK